MTVKPKTPSTGFTSADTELSEMTAGGVDDADSGKQKQKSKTYAKRTPERGKSNLKK